MPTALPIHTAAHDLLKLFGSHIGDLPKDAENNSSSDEDIQRVKSADSTTHMGNQRAADYRYRGKRQGHAITKHISRNWALASMGQQTSIFTPRNNASVEAGNEGLVDILGLQGAFVDTGLKKSGKVFQNGKKSCTVIDTAKKAFKPVTDPESTESEVEAGTKKTRGILKRYIDRGSRKRAKKHDGKRRSKKAKSRRAKKGDDKRRSKKAKADDEEHADEDIDCEGMDKILKKGDEDDEEDRGNGPEGNGGGVFDAIPSGTTSKAQVHEQWPCIP